MIVLVCVKNFYVVFVQAKAAISGGLRKARERSALAKVNRDGQGSKKSDQSTNSSDSSRYIFTSCFGF